MKRERERESSSARGPSGGVERESLEARVRAPGDASQRAYERAYGTSRREGREARGTSSEAVALRDDAKGSRNSLSVSFIGFCVNACGKAPVGDKIESYKCCRVSRSRGSSFTALCLFACKYLHCVLSFAVNDCPFIHVLLNVLV